MVDTKRTSTDLLTNLFQDGQGANAISENDLRDFLVSLLQPYGGVEMEANAAETTINTINVYEVIAGTFTATNLREVTVSAAGLFTYTGTPDRHFSLAANMSFEAAVSNKIIKFAWFKNGTVIPAETQHKILVNTDINTLSVHSDITLVTSDTLQLKVANATDNTNFTIVDFYAFIQGMFS